MTRTRPDAPAPLCVQCARTWRRTLHPPRRSRWPTAGAMAVICACLGVWLWSYSAMPSRDAVPVAPRVVLR